MITSSPLLTIGGIDMSKYIALGSWDVNEEAIDERWEDANRRTHRGIVRTRVSGGFTAKFVDISAYETFLNIMNDPVYRNPDGTGAVHCVVYINNRKETREIDAFFDFTCKDYIPILGSSQDEGISVTLEER